MSQDLRTIEGVLGNALPEPNPFRYELSWLGGKARARERVRPKGRAAAGKRRWQERNACRPRRPGDMGRLITR